MRTCWPGAKPRNASQAATPSPLPASAPLGYSFEIARCPAFAPRCSGIVSASSPLLRSFAAMHPRSEPSLHSEPTLQSNSPFAAHYGSAPRGRAASSCASIAVHQPKGSAAARFPLRGLCCEVAMRGCDARSPLRGLRCEGSATRSPLRGRRGMSPLRCWGSVPQPPNRAAGGQGGMRSRTGPRTGAGAASIRVRASSPALPPLHGSARTPRAKECGPNAPA